MALALGLTFAFAACGGGNDSKSTASASGEKASTTDTGSVPAIDACSLTSISELRNIFGEQFVSDSNSSSGKCEFTSPSDTVVIDAFIYDPASDFDSFEQSLGGIRSDVGGHKAYWVPNLSELDVLFDPLQVDISIGTARDDAANRAFAAQVAQSVASHIP
jgi:hypothetical protein